MSKNLRCEICGKEISNIKFEYSTPDGTLRMIVCADCVKDPKEVKKAWERQLVRYKAKKI